jgi:hypothetical protein
MNSTVSALAVSGTNLYAGGTFSAAGGNVANSIAKWDGSSWSALGRPSGLGLNSVVNALAISQTDVYAGGYFTMAGGKVANYIAKWDGGWLVGLGVGDERLCLCLGGFGDEPLRGRIFHDGGR